MNVIYVSSLCSDKMFFKIFKNPSKMPGQQVQKYHRLLCEGFVMNGYEVHTVSGVPITSKNFNKKIFHTKKEEISGVNYNYVSIFNLPVLKNISVIIGTFIKCLKLIFKDKDSVVICDVLNISSSIGALLVSKIFNVKIVGIVTDIPNDIFSSKKPLLMKINNNLIKWYDYYVLLTDQMNTIVNQKNKPYIVLEGHVDSKMVFVENMSYKKHTNKICIYAGMIQKKYGIKNLTEGFIKASIPQAELHIYGDGDYKEELIDLCKKHKNVKYFGTVPNKQIIEEELKATLLINPRFSNEEFTKYSFPSKNMEYMASGTPLLTTKLPGMPLDYLEYVYLIDDESVNGIAETLKKVLNKPINELNNKGIAAKKFVLKYKSNKIQANKIVNFIKEASS